MHLGLTAAAMGRHLAAMYPHDPVDDGLPPRIFTRHLLWAGVELLLRSS